MKPPRMPTLEDRIKDIRDEIDAFVAGIPDPKRLWVVEGATHLCPGKLDELEEAVATAVDWLDAIGP